MHEPEVVVLGPKSGSLTAILVMNPDGVVALSDMMTQI